MDRVTRCLLLSLLLGHAPLAGAACPPPPAGFAPPPATRQPLDLVRELAAPWQAGGEIAVACTRDGWPQAGRLAASPRDRAEELARRRAAWDLVRRFNLARAPGEVKPRSLPVTPAQEALLERFALSDAGAAWMRQVVDDTLRAFNQGELEASREVWNQARRGGRMPALHDLVSDRLSEGAEFTQSTPLFKIYAYAGEGALAEPGLIGLGDAGFRCEFPASRQMVDPHAILSHEFGHSRYGDPASAGSLEGEARTVARFENPVRERDGYEPRTVYYLRPAAQAEHKPRLIDRLVELETVEGINVEDRRAIEQIHCACPAPLPVTVDCEVRERPDTGEPLQPAAEHDCKVRLLPGRP